MKVSLSKWLHSHLHHHGRRTAYVVVGTLTAGLAVAYFFVEGGKDLLGNFLAEAVGVLFTIAIIDTLLRQAEVRRNRPVRVAAYRRALAVLNEIVQLWTQMVLHASAKMPPANSSLFGALTTREVAQHLRLDAQAPVLPAMTWRAYLAYQAGQIQGSIGQCLQLYSMHLFPRTIAALEAVNQIPLIVFAKAGETVAKVHAGMGVTTWKVFSYDLNSPGSSDIQAITSLHAALTSEYEGLGIDADIAAVPSLEFSADLVATPTPNLGKSRQP